MGSMNVSSCRCMLISCMHPVAVLNAAFCMTQFVNACQETTIWRRGPTEGTCSMAVPAMSTRPRTSALRLPSTNPAIRKANYR